MFCMRLSFLGHELLLMPMRDAYAVTQACVGNVDEKRGMVDLIFEIEANFVACHLVLRKVESTYLYLFLKLWRRLINVSLQHCYQSTLHEGKSLGLKMSRLF